MKKRLVMLATLVTLLAATLYASEPGPGADCCSTYCGDDKACYHACIHDPGGPCPR
jgi:hypothetical protein